MKNCSNLCTAEKCAELEKQISDLTLEFLALKIQLETLKIDFANHLSQDIPNAHKYNPQLNFSLNIENGWLYGDVYLDNSNASSQVQLPTPEVLVDVFDTGDNNFTIKVGVDGQFDEDSFTVNIPENEPPFVTVDVFDTGENNFTIKVGVDGQFDEDSFTVTIPEVETEQHIKSDLKGSGSFQDDTLTITIADGESSDTFQVSIPITDLTSTTFITEKVFMNCDELEQLIINLENNLTERLTNIEYSSQKIFNVLGGDNWQFTNPNDPNLPTWLINPEATIKQNGTNLYAQTGGDTLTAENIFELITGLMAVNYFRQGHHRLPATVLTSLVNTDEGNQPLTIEDSLSFSEWIVRQLDAVVGEFPLNLKYQGQNSEGESEEQTIPIQNLSEGIAELLGLSLGIGSDSDTLINIGMKTLVEARSAANAAIVAGDYAAGNAEYLGYKGNPYERKIPLTFTPGAKTLAESLQPSEKSIISWKNEDTETLVELIKRTLVGAEIIKAGLFHPWQPGQPITGDKIKEDREAQQQQNEEKWEQFKQRINNPSGRYDLNKPKAQIKDLTVDTPEA